MTISFNDSNEHLYIICGRGSRKYNCKGNKKLRNLVAKNLAFYIDASTARAEKSKLVDKVSRTLLESGMHFIKPKKSANPRDDDSNWEELSYAQARAKVAHRFRDAARRVYAGEDDLLASPCFSPSFNGSSDSDDDSSSVLTGSSNDEEKEHEPSITAAPPQLPVTTRLRNLRPRRVPPNKKSTMVTRGTSAHHINIVTVIAPTDVASSSPEEMGYKGVGQGNSNSQQNNDDLTPDDIISLQQEIDAILISSSSKILNERAPPNNSRFSNMFYRNSSQVPAAVPCNSSASQGSDNLLDDEISVDFTTDEEMSFEGADDTRGGNTQLLQYIEELEEVILGQNNTARSI